MDHVIDILTDREIPFRVVYGRREYVDGMLSEREVVSFYDRRFTMSHNPHGQFVSDYFPESLFDHGNDALSLDGGVLNWVIDRASMVLILDWLESLLDH